MVRLTGERAGGSWRELPAGRRRGPARMASLARRPSSLRADRPGEDGGSDRYRYDPSDPTPSLGGPVLLEREPVLDNRVARGRSDVLTYTTPPLPAAYEAIGPVRVELWVTASEPYFDMFARVCDVDRDGASWNVCDALARVTSWRLDRSDDGTWRVAFDLWPTGHGFAAGHRIRLQVSSGAHPRYARNPGTGEDAINATTLRPVEIEVLRDREHPSVLVLPRAGAPPLS